MSARLKQKRRMRLFLAVERVHHMAYVLSSPGDDSGKKLAMKEMPAVAKELGQSLNLVMGLRRDTWLGYEHI